MTEISKTSSAGLTLGDLYDLMADATAMGLRRDAEVWARTKPEIRFDRPLTALSVTISGERE